MTTDNPDWREVLKEFIEAVTSQKDGGVVGLIEEHNPAHYMPSPTVLACDYHPAPESLQ